MVKIMMIAMIIVGVIFYLSKTDGFVRGKVYHYNGIIAFFFPTQKYGILDLNKTFKEISNHRHKHKYTSEKK